MKARWSAAQGNPCRFVRCGAAALGLPTGATGAGSCGPRTSPKGLALLEGGDPQQTRFITKKPRAGAPDRTRLLQGVEGRVDLLPAGANQQGELALGDAE